MIILTIFAGIMGHTAKAHFLYHKSHLTLKERERFQLKVISHDKSTLLWFKNHPIRAVQGLRQLLILQKRRSITRFHYFQLKWVRRELRETREALAAKIRREREALQRRLEAQKKAKEQ